MSARPARIMSSANASASEPEAQAETGTCTPARAFSSRPTAAPGPFGMSIGTVCGLTRRGAALAHRVVLGEEGREPADAGGHADAEALGVDLRCSGIGPRLTRGDQRDLLDAVELAGLRCADLR